MKDKRTQDRIQKQDRGPTGGRGQQAQIKVVMAARQRNQCGKRVNQGREDMQRNQVTGKGRTAC